MRGSKVISEEELSGWWERVPDDLDLFGHKGGLLDHESNRGFWEALRDRHPDHVKIHELGWTAEGRRRWCSQVGNGPCNIVMMPEGHAGVEPTPYTTAAFWGLERLRSPALLRWQSWNLFSVDGDRMAMNARSMNATNLFDVLWFGRREPDPTLQINGGFARPKRHDDIPGSWLERSNETCAAIESRLEQIESTVVRSRYANERRRHHIAVWIDGHEQNVGIGTHMKMWARDRAMAHAIRVAGEFEHIPALLARFIQEKFDRESLVRCRGTTLDLAPPFLLPGTRNTFPAVTEEQLSKLFVGTSIGRMGYERAAVGSPLLSAWVMETTQYQVHGELGSGFASVRGLNGRAATWLPVYAFAMNEALGIIRTRRIEGPLAAMALRLTEANKWGMELPPPRTGYMRIDELCQRNDVYPLYTIRWLGLVHEVLDGHSGLTRDEEVLKASLRLLAEHMFNMSSCAHLLDRVPAADNVRAHIGYFEGVSQAMTLGRTLDFSSVAPEERDVRAEVKDALDYLKSEVTRTKHGVAAPNQGWY